MSRLTPTCTVTQHEHSSQTFTPGYTRHAWRAPTASWQSATVLARNNVSPWRCLLVDRTEGERRARHALILPDSLAADDFRRLRVWLCWQAQVEGGQQWGYRIRDSYSG